MANRTTHVSFGVFLGAAYIPIDFIIINQKFGVTSLSEIWLFWVIAILLAIIGSEGPDFDQLYSFMSHRDIVSHSAFYPGVIFGLCMWWRFTVNDPLVSSFIPFLIAYSSHLFLDYFPNINLRDLHKGEIRIGEKKGTFLMHVPFIYKDKDGKVRRTLGVKKTEWWLLSNSFLCIAMATLLALARLYADLDIPSLLMP
ncbi:MAG: metal-dependent hydrolase [Candidatus Thorarchaeota archaeon]